MVVIGGGAVSYERGTPVLGLLETKDTHRPWGDPMLLAIVLLQDPTALRVPFVVQGYLAHKKTPTPPRTLLGP
jgi:hypothetical protein